MGYMDFGTIEDAESNALPRLDGIDVLGEVVLRHGYADLVGVTLLHRHYGLAAQEVLMTDAVEGCLISKPVPDSTTGLIGRRWLWDQEQKRWCAYEYITEAAMSEQISSIRRLLADKAFWLELGKIVGSSGLAKLFGITLHDPRSKTLPSEKTLLEVNAADTRRTIVCEVPSGSASEIESGVTVWNFFEVESGKRGSLGCAHGNTQHCCGNLKKAKQVLDKINAPVHLLDVAEG